MLHLLKGASRLAVVMLLVGVSSAFGAMYSFDLSSATRTVNGTFIVVGTPLDGGDPVAVQLSSLVTPANVAGQVVRDTDGAGVTADGQGGGSSPDDNIEGGASAEALIITPVNTDGSPLAPFTATVQSVTFTNTESGGGGDDAAIFLDDATASGGAAFDIPIAPPNGTFTWSPAAGSATFTSNISFRNSDGNDDFKVSEIVLDINVGEVPEPSTWTLFGLGIAGLAWMRRRKAA